MIILAIQSTYTSIEFGLYRHDTNAPVASSSVSKAETAKLLERINTILHTNSLAIQDIVGCIVNQGPAPFTTLRTVIATVNGIAAVRRIPILGINGLAALNEEYSLHQKNNIILLNAFANDFYFYINTVQNGICSLDTIKELIQKHHIVSIIGNGIPLIKHVLHNTNNHYQYIDPEKGTCSLDTLVKSGMQQITTQILKQKFVEPAYVAPLYYKEINIF
ncbi:hypothetical protein EKK58_03500 [Candidatus Dependentiae bacterium]|nr:MAG: hypothetical protein EKK58_03500 [Candidatus Dependentiae bacterium]